MIAKVCDISSYLWTALVEGAFFLDEWMDGCMHRYMHVSKQTSA